MSGTTKPGALPKGLLMTFYGDDYTGSSAVMEALAFAGLPTVLFLEAPDPDKLARFAGHRAIGVAGIARSQGPAWMVEHLPSVFGLMAGLGAPISLYKVCSTFDSSPTVGSIGHAADLAAPILGGAWHPMIVAEPLMGRYQAFGNLFATVDGAGYRLDRHPTMARHPVTPMDEADLRLHLGKQTSQPIGLVDFVSMKQGLADSALARERASGAQIISLDVIDDETRAEAGRLIWQNRGERLFAVGSQGVAYALVAHWREVGLLPADVAVPKLGRAERIVCVSGSCSPVTAGQIVYAEARGFETIRLDASKAVDPAAWRRESGSAVERALAAIGRGRDPIVFTALGPDDPAVAAVRSAAQASGMAVSQANERIGAGLGTVLDNVLRTSRIKRAVIAGGDTSGQAAAALGIYAVTAVAPIASGSPLCRAHAVEAAHDGLEISFKGGQVGQVDFFLAAKGDAIDRA